MRSFRYLLKATGLILVFAAYSAGPQSITSVNAKQVVINSASFWDKKGGIHRLVKVEEDMGFIDCDSYFRYRRLTSRIDEIKEEIEALRCKRLDTESKMKELLAVTHDSWEAEEDNKNCMKRIREERIAPVLKEIEAKIKEFAQIRKYNIVAGSRSDGGFPLITVGEIEDVTAEFVDYFNASEAGLRKK